MEDKAVKPKKKSNKHIEYKGVHYNKEKQIRYYEFGAHFKYQELYDILLKLTQSEGEATNCDTASLTNKINEKFILSDKHRDDKKTSSNEVIKISKSPKDSFGDIVLTDEERENDAKRNSKASNNKIKSNLNSNKNIPEVKHKSITENGKKKTNKDSLPFLINNTNSGNNFAKPSISMTTQKLNKIVSSVDKNQIKKSNINTSFGNVESKVHNWNSIPVKQDKAKSTVVFKKPIENPDSILPKIDTGLKSIAPLKKGKY